MKQARKGRSARASKRRYAKQTAPLNAKRDRVEPIGLLPRVSANGAKPSIKPETTTLALVQFAPRKGDVEANFERIEQVFSALRHDREGFPQVIVFPEACLSGYFVEGGVRDVALPAKTVVERLRKIAAKVCGRNNPPFDVVLGFYEDDGGKLYNSALYASIAGRPQLRHVHRKLFLPTYGIFDEERFVSRGRGVQAFETAHGKAAILICEDACHAVSVTIAALRGAQIIYIPSASPGRGLEEIEPANVRMWRDVTRVAAAEHGVFIAYAGLVGFEGGKGFTGASKVMGPFGDLRIEAPFDGAAIVRAAISLRDVKIARAALPALGDLEANLAEFSVMFEEEVDKRPVVNRKRKQQ